MLAIVLFAAAARLVHMDWDQNHHFHPDERAVVSAVQRLSFRPFQWNPQWFNYGSLPIYLTKITSSVAALVDPQAASYDGLMLQGRYVSAVIGALTVFVLMLLGSRLYDRSVGLLAGLLLAACVLHIQYSRFLAVDVPLTFFVLLALYALVGVSREGRATQFMLAGMCIGFATATKFSAMPLFVPLGVAALHRYVVERRLLSVASRCALAVVVAVAAFALAQPYALIDFKTFYHDVFEQSTMVRTAGVYPYTTQYMHTPKYVYDVTQLVLWGMAPALGVVAVWASATRAAVAWRERRAEEWVLLAWVIPFFLITGWFEVKFPRYLLPIYPLMILWAADWLVRKYRSGSLFGRVAAPLVVAGTLAAAVAFMSIYTRPHTVVTASEWVYRHLPSGSKILSQNWDEGFPFSLPGHGVTTYHIEEFGYYERPDNSTKMQKLSQALASSDYIAFQTKRLYGAVTRAPECDPKQPEKPCYPLTSKYFYELFAGDLGYTLIQEIASRPSLFGIEIPDELGDESLTVYDHPKVLIFQNTGHLDAATLFDRIMSPLYPSKPLTRNDLLMARPGNEASSETTATAPPIRSSPLALVLFAMLVEVLSLAMFPLLRRWLTGFGTLALSKTLGVLLFAYVSWLLVSLGMASFTQGTLTAVVAIFVLIGAVAWQRGQRVPLTRAEIIATEALFWGAFAFFLLVRMYNPEVFWGEKPMDFSFLNALTRATTLPPPEPWFAGSPLQYSYFGYYTVAALGKTLHLDPALTFNLGIALVAGLTAAAAFAVGAAITSHWQTGVLAAFFVALIGNLAGPRELMTAHKIVNFDYFWATSRVVRDTINEFPLWSFLFADLHAHVMVMPISLTFLCLTVMWLRLRVIHPHQPRPAGTTLVLLALLCLALGGIVVTNAWSMPTYVLLFPFLVGTIWLTEGDHRGFFRLVWGGISRVLLPTAAVVAGAGVLFLPFFLHFIPPERNWGWERGTLVAPQDFLTIWGLFLFALVPFLYALWARDLRREGPRLESERFGVFRLGLLLLGVGVLLASLFVSTRAFALILFFLALQVLLAPRTPTRWRIPVALASFAFAVTAGCELVFVWDRMNTIFKFYLEVWFLLAIAAAVAAGALWSGELRLPWLRRSWQALFVGLIAVGLFTAGTDTYGVIHTNRVPQEKPTLDGMAYLRLKAPDELGAYEWLNRNIQGIPVVLEAHGDAYQEFTRVSMNTGLPTVLGWSYHVFQRAHPWNEINRRKADIQLAYTSSEKDTVAAILERYHVALVFVGALERRTYAGGNLPNFTQWTDLLSPVYQNPGVTVFAVNGRFAGTMPVSTIEELPAVAGGEEAAPAADAPGIVHQPRGIAITATGNIVVCDFSNNRIQELNRELTFVRGWGSHGELPGQFKDPCGVAVAPTGEIVVADTWNQRVQIFDKDGKYLREFGAGFYGPRGVTVDAKGTIFVADTGNGRITRFSLSGQKEIEWGSKGAAAGQFLEPVGIITNAAGQVYVCDNGNSRVQIFTRDGQFVSAFNVPGWASAVYSEPYITLDPKETIWVTVPVAKEVRAYDKSGKLLHTIKSQTVPGVAFEIPIGIAYAGGAHPELIVGDLENRLVRIPYVP
jgi:YYY domain-containing protein